MSEQSLKEIQALEDALKREGLDDKYLSKEDYKDAVREEEKEDERQEKEEVVVEEKKELDVAKSETTESNKIDYEKEALEMGWNPDGPKSAEEWVRNAPVYKEKQAYKKRMDKLEKMVSSLTEQLKTQRDLGFQDALKQLEAEQLRAVSEGDVDRYQEIQKEKESYKSQTTLEDLNSRFFEKYGDYMEDPELKRYIYGEDAILRSEKHDIHTHFKLLEERAKQIIDKHEQSKKDLEIEPKKPSYVSSNVNRPTKAPKKVTINDLRGEQRNMAEYLRKHPDNGITVDQFIEGLIARGEI